MAELASGAVSSLLGVIRNEALLLGRVRHDVQFIREEMESMQSFLTHLSKKAPAGGEHDEQIRTWMNQVRLLAQDSNNCIDMYLYRGNPDLHLARGGLRRYVAWLPWFLHKMVAQHHAAIQLRALRERARDIGERRLRYGVEVPANVAGGEQSPPGAGPMSVVESSSSAYGATTSITSGDEEEYNDDELVLATTMTGHSGLTGAFFKPRTLEDNVRMKLAQWIEDVARHNTSEDKSIPSIAIVAPDQQETLAIAKEASDMWGKHGQCSVLVDIPAVHFYDDALRTQEILYYILRELQSTKSQPQEREVQVDGEEGTNKIKSAIRSEKDKLLEKITEQVLGMKVDNKISEINNTIEKMKGTELQLNLSANQLGMMKSTKDEPIGVFLQALWLLKNKPVDEASGTKQSHERKKATHSERKEDSCSYEDIIKETAKQFKNHMEEDAEETNKQFEQPIHLEESHYEHILRELFPPVPPNKPRQGREKDSKQATTINGTIILVEDQFKDMIRKVLQELQEDNTVKKPEPAELQDGKSLKKQDAFELQEDKSMKKIDTPEGKPSNGCISDALIEETKEVISEIEWKMYWQLGYKCIMDKIHDCLKGQGHHKIFVILKLDDDFVSGWGKTKNAFNMSGFIAGALMLTSEINIARAKKYCCEGQDPIDYSLPGLYYDIVLELTRREVIEDSSQIFRDILDNCQQNEFCMKIFVHALYANPKRSNEELSKLHRTLQKVKKKSLDNVAKMLKFSYSDLPNEYKSCLLYLAIFPQRQHIRRSTLIGRWVVEGLITKEDWASSVRHANRCFDALVNRWLIYPTGIGATGKVKSCVIGAEVHGFITKIARKRRIVETRLSHHLARHFSIFNDLRLRGSDKIDKFFSKLYEESSRVSLIKVLDLEGCQCFGGKNQRYLKHICRMMLLLKYLSLRGTDVTQLPSEINNLRELEVLDIRETNVPTSATVNLLLVKLKRLLAGRVILNPGEVSTELSSVKVPEKVERMLNMEVLSNVKARNSQDLKDIGKLWQLRKLGVVIKKDKEKHFRNLLRAISDLHECLKSLSITLPKNDEDPNSDEDPKSDQNPSTQEFTESVLKHYEHAPKLLESLSITGTTQRGKILQQLTKDSKDLKLAKVTLTRTKLNKADLEDLGMLPKIMSLRLRDKAYMDSKLTFGNDEFKKLKYFLVEGSNMNDISFAGGALQLEKIVLRSTDGLESLSGVEDLQELKEVELNNSNTLSLFMKAKYISKVTLCHNILSQDEVEILAKMPSIRSLILKENSYTQKHLIFNKDGFLWLNVLIVNFSVTPKISFASGSAPKLEKIACSITKNTVGTLSISGIDNLPKLKELEVNGYIVPGEVDEALKKHKNKPKLTHNKPEHQYQEAGNIEEKKDAPRFPAFWKRED
ncbi:hypothetical protein ACQJBY_062256 [Aegilops geniculata]